jgi:hypothetical protein
VSVSKVMLTADVELETSQGEIYCDIVSGSASRLAAPRKQSAVEMGLLQNRCKRERFTHGNGRLRVSQPDEKRRIYAISRRR